MLVQLPCKQPAIFGKIDLRLLLLAGGQATLTYWDKLKGGVMNPMYNLHVPKELKANVGENSIHLVHVPIMISLTWICLKNAWKK